MNESNEARLIASLAERVGAPDTDGNSLQVLEQLRAMFTMAIAFENLSVLSEAPVSLTPIDVLNKLAKKRGGYCFELNTAFAALLGNYGVESKMHLYRYLLQSVSVSGRFRPINSGMLVRQTRV